ncbi:MAG: hypothetical protein AAFV07_02760 [Bacteroidota bacterium]
MKDANLTSHMSIEQMLAFLQGTLSEAEVEAIEAQLQNDPLQTLALQELDLALRAGQTPEELLEQARQSKSWAQAEIESRINSGEARIKNLGAPTGARRWMAAAIILLLLVPVGFWVLKPNPTAQLAKSALAEHYPVPGTRGAGEQVSVPRLMEKAYTAYSQDRYSEALPYFEELVEQHEGELSPEQLRRVLLFEGISQLKARPSQPAQARQTLAKAEAMKVPAAADVEIAAQWYQALTWLQEQNTQKALEALQPLSEKPNRFQRKAKSLMSEIEAL